MKPWKVQKFFEDVVYDLRNRGLLPIVILLVVAMVAVPVLISRGDSGSTAAAPVQAASAAELAPENLEAVVAYNPGLRSYKDRLASAPKDPFQQQHAQAGGGAASALESTVTGTTEPVTAGTGAGGAPIGGPDVTTGGSDTGSKGGKKKKQKKKRQRRKLSWFYYAASVEVGEAGSTLTPLSKVDPLGMLPSAEAPVFTYLGSIDGQTAVFATSNSVGQLGGDGTCSPSPEDCSLLYLKPGQSEQGLYTPDGKTYQLRLNALNLIRGKPSI